MGYIVAGGLSLIFLIWLAWFNTTNKDKPLEITKQFNNKNTIKLDENLKVICPKCHSTQIQLMKRGWKITTGFIGSSKNERVCVACKYKF